jgi:hypothetical protein
MSEFTVTVAISETAYAKAQQIADDSALPIERVLSQRLESALDDLAGLPADERAELAALQHLSDDTLWTIAAEQMPRSSQERLTLLLALNKRGSLTDAENSELDALLAYGDRLMLRKAEAAAILTKRGNTVTSKDMTSRHE